MMSSSPLRKPKLHFDTGANPSHLTFDDGKELRRNIPWLHFVEARWAYGEPDVLKMEIGEWLVVLRGHNLGPLFLAIEDRTLLRVRAQPDLTQDHERQHDTFVTRVEFTKPPSKPAEVQRRGQIEFDLGGGK